jgi:hypothetical protein
MYYDGSDLGIECIGHATSEDGSTWIKDPLNPVIVIGSPGSWDELQVFPMGGSIIYDGNIFKMWYGGGNSYSRWRIGYATSSDGVTWTKDEQHNPVLNFSETGEWDGYSVIPGSVIYDGTAYHMWYCGCVIDTYKWRIGYATSSDGINWTKDTINNPVIDWGPSGSWDQDLVFDGSVIYNSIDQSFKMWYTGGMFFDNGCIGYATSSHTAINEPAVTENSKNMVECLFFPNPTHGIVDCRLSILDCRWISLKIYDLNGRKVADLMDAQLQAGEHVVRYDMSGLQEGVYFVRTIAGMEAAVGKIVKIH